MRGGQGVPLVGIALLKRQALAVWPVAEQDRVGALIVGPEDVSAQLKTVVHDDRNVPINAHAVASITSQARPSVCPSQTFCR